MNAEAPAARPADGAQISAFVDALFRYCEIGTFVSLRGFFDNKDGVFGITAHELGNDLSRLTNAATRFASRCASAADAVVFCPPIASFTNGDDADERHLANGLALSVECDKTPAAAQARLESLLGPATIIVASGGEWTDPETGEVQDKLHLHWRLNEPTKDKGRHDLLKRARVLATGLVGGDATNKPIVHPIRWAGSWHRKGPPRLARIVTQTDKEIDLQDAVERLQDAAGAMQASPQAETFQEPTPGEERDTAALVAEILTGSDYHSPIAALAMRLLKAAMPDAQAVLYLRGIMLAVPVSLRDMKEGTAHLGRWQSRYDDIPRAVRTARAKIGPQTREAPEPQEAREPPPAAGTSLFDPWNALQPPPFPIEALPAVLRAFVEDRSRVIGADPCGLAWACIGACSTALDGRIRLQMKQRDTWTVPPFIWLALVGAPSTKKSPILDAAWSPLERAQAGDLRAWREEHVRWKALPKKEQAETPEPVCRQRLVSHDATIESLQDILGRQDRGIGILRDELAGWIGSLEKYSGNRGSAADRAFFLQAFNGGAYIADRVSRGTTAIENLGLGISGGIQPDRLRQMGDITSDGLWQRFIPIIVGPASFGSDDSDGQAVSDYAAVVDRLLRVSPETRVQLSQDAHGVREELARRLFDLEQTEAIGAAFSALCGKLLGIWGRVCLVLSQIEPAPVPFIVSRETAEAARTLIFESVLPNAARVYTGMGGGGANAEATQSIAGFILTKRKERVLASDLTRNVRVCRGQTLPELHKLVSPLVAGGWLEPEIEFNATAWAVSQNVATHFADRARRETVRRGVVRELILGTGRRDQET